MLSDLIMSHGKISDFVSFPLLRFTLGIIHKGCPHIRGGGGQEKVEKCGQGEGVVGQMWTSTWKKHNSYHICEIYSDNLAVCLYI